MALTRPSFNNLNTNLAAFSDSLTITNFGNVANRDLGGVFDRSQGGSSNVAIIWRESIQGFALVYTSGTGKETGNLTVTANANLTVGNMFVASSANVDTLTASGTVTARELTASQSAGDEGGQLNLALAATNTTLVGNVVVDVYQNKFRIFEGGGTNRGGYFDLTTLSAGASTNLGAASATPPGGSSTQIQYNNASSFAGAASLLYQANGQVIANAGISSTGTTTGTMIVTGGAGISGDLWVDRVYASNNGNGTNFRVGDDIWLGDINAANTMRLTGAQDGTRAYIVFGNVNSLTLGRDGSNPLTYQGAFTAQGGITNTPIGNATASTGTFTTLVATGTSSLNGTVSTNNIQPFGNANANIGSAALQYNTVFAKATSAQYADLAEKYVADAEYAPGTVVIFGGEHEITISTETHDTRVAGVISTDPAYLMNSGAEGLAVAFTGRVPCRVKGPVYKGDVLVTSMIPGTAQKIDHSMYRPGSVIGKALENNLTEDVQLIEVVVGRF